MTAELILRILTMIMGSAPNLVQDVKTVKDVIKDHVADDATKAQQIAQAAGQFAQHAAQAAAEVIGTVSGGGQSQAGAAGVQPAPQPVQANPSTASGPGGTTNTP